MNGRVAYLGVAFLLLGAALLASPTFGFETIAADRTTDVSTAGDSTALLAFEQTTESIAGRQDTATAFYLRNNADETLQLSVQNTIAASGDVQIANDGSGTIAPGEATQVVVECNGGGSSGTTTVTTTVTQAVGSTMTIADASSTTTVDYDCTGGGGGTGPANFAANDIQYDGSTWTQTFEIDVTAIKNKGQVTIDLSDAQANAGVDYSQASATLQSGQSARSFGFDSQSSTITFEAQGNPSGTLVIELSGLQLTSDQDGTASFSDSAGRSGSDPFEVPAVGTGNGGTTTDGDVVVKNGTTASGEIVAGGDVIVGDAATTNDPVDAGGAVTYGDGSTAHGAIDADGSVTFGDDTTVNNGIESGQDVVIGSQSTVNGDINGDGTVRIGSGTTVNDNIYTSGDVYLEDGSTVYGDIQTSGTVYIGCDVTTTGNIDAQTQNTC